MQNFRKIQWIVIDNFPDGRTHACTRVNCKVPIPTKVGGPKIVNDIFAGIETFKFEFSTIKNHYNDIHNDILDKQRKKPQKGCFLALKEPPEHTPKSYPGVQMNKIM